MSKTPIGPEFPIWAGPSREKVMLPQQARLAAARAEDLIVGKRTRPVAKAETRSARKVSYSDAQIDEVLGRWDQGNLKLNDPEFAVIIELAREGARLVKAHRRGAQTPRKTSAQVTRRLEAVIQAFRELSPSRQKHATGQQTIERLRKAVIQKLRLPDNDDVVSEDTVRQDLRQIRPLLRLVQQGKLPLDKRPAKRTISEQTRREMEAGRAALASASATDTSPEPSDPPSERRHHDF